MLILFLQRRVPLFFTLLLICGLVCTASAQSTTQGAIAGTVFDSSGAVVSGASITIHNTGTNADITLTADGSGYFKAPLVEPGTYSVTVTASGFASFRADALVVQVGQVTPVEPHLSVTAASTSVVVTEQAPVVNLDSPDFNSVLNAKALTSIPINNRRWSSLAMTTPGVVSDSNGYGLVSIRGVSPVLNNVEIDGADDNQAYYSEERGRTREAYSTSASAVREFAVNTGVYSAEYGRAAGGVITSVTKSGTNQLHGEAYFWDRQSNWAAFNDYATESVFDPAANKYNPTHIKPEDLRKIYGFTVGGPLIKDKLFWMYTYDQHTHVFPGTAVPNNPNSFYALPSPSTAWTSSGESCNTATGYLTEGSGTDTNYTLNSQACTLAARQGVGYDQGVSLYNAGIAALTTDLGIVSRFGYQEINTPKLDWQINSREHLSVLYHRLRWDSPGGVQTSATADYGRDTWGNDFVKLDYGVTKLTSLISTNMSNELLYQYGRELNDEGQQPFTPYTLANLVGTGASAGNIPEVAVDTAEGMNIGSPYYSYRKALPDERKWQIGDTFYWSHGNHTLKFGVDEVHNYDLINNTYESNGDYSYQYVGNYINDQLNRNNGKTNTCDSGASSAGTAPSSKGSGTAVGTSSCYADFYQGFGNPVYAISTMDNAAFVQDNWKFLPRLTLELGLRWDYETIPPATPSLITAVGSFVPYPQLANHPSDKTNFGPRIGFSYDVYGQGRTVLRGGYGMYYGRLNNGELLLTRLTTGSPNGQYTTTYKANTGGAPQFANIETGSGAAAAKPTSNFLASNLRNPEVQEYDLSLQQQITRGTVFSLSYLGALGRRLPNFLDVNLNPVQTPITVTISDASGKGPLPNGAHYQVPQFTGYGNTALFGAAASSFQAIQEMVSNVNSNYNALVAEVQNQTLRSLQFDVNYTWSHALDYAQNANTSTTGGNSWYNPYQDARINYGDSNYNVPNRFVAYALYNLPNVQSGNWVKWLANDWSVNDSFQMQNGLPYTVGVSGFFSAGILSDWNGGSGSTMIPMIGVNTKRYPRRMVDDLRVQKSIAFTSRYHLELMANVFNLANHQNIDGLGTTAYKLSGTTATYQGQGLSNPSNNTYQVVTSSNNSGFLYTPRQIEISTRFVF
ncbi:TonB-dependent receptor [Paracidobacterium acidisoli]|uniref:TonB-dependent receptor n=1 Tax=Paracidobacterium acidisoli TaxID=2303751 RepID=A0A372IMP7_9BACT|nr:TonB-dependent receptor [Paracidobacterium acidisoli]MBT9331780.1 TonB-dependent receptor [Paracidobacterium acidisoli]